MAKNTYKTLLEVVGNTPLIRIPVESKATVLAKLEYLNPGGSLKDRSALYMVEKAEKEGILKPGGTIIEASSGNQGIALAMIGALKGYTVIITVPERTSAEKVATLRAYGAQVYVCTESSSGSMKGGHHLKAQELLEQIPGSFMPNQYYNMSNAQAHYLTTGPEIWRQTNGSITHLIVGAGTCGTVSGLSRYLKEQNPAIQIIGVDVATSAYSSKNPKKYKVEGIGIDTLTSDLLKTAVMDTVIPVTDDESFAMTREMAQKGFLLGLSSGAVMHAVAHYTKNLSENDVVVTIFGDSGRAYLSKVFMNQEITHTHAATSQTGKQTSA